jgi:2-polyprenyl-3-methyl-5-hydroxy-6-metoxy-1,4-benzoquinol methylase
MGKTRKIETQEVGLELGLILLKYLVKTEHLHYGFFSNGLEADIANLAKAHENYVDFLLSRIPEGVETILDVGCGSGKMARTMIDRGYRVDCVSPSGLLMKYAKEMLGDESEIFKCKFQDLHTDKRYDLILFGESFQYIPIDQAIVKSLEFSTSGGYILISDFFKTDAPGKCSLGGGHKLLDWERKMKEYPTELFRKQDITKETAPTMYIVNAFTLQVLHPIWDLIFTVLENRYLRLLKLLKWRYRKKITKIENKHFRGERNSENFRIHKKYMFYLLHKNSSGI